MSRIDGLIRQMCPGGVEFAPLREVAGYSSTRVSATSVDAMTFVGVDNLLPAKQGKTEATYLPTRGNVTEFCAGDVLLGNIRPYLKKVWFATHAGGCSPDVLAIRATDTASCRVLPRFLYYALSSDAFFAFDVQHAQGGKMPRGNKQKILNYRVPVPPIEVQQEVVRTLDAFVALDSELEAELQARRLQYAHYRHALMEPSTEVAAVRMDEVLDLRSGKFVSAAQIQPEASDDHSYACFGGNGIRGYVASPNQDGRLLLIGRQGALSGNVRRVSGKFYATEHAVVVTVGADLDVDWAFHMLTVMNLNQYVSQGAQPGLAVATLKALELPLPPLAEQRRIATILDKFDALVNDLSIGIPAELNARRTQYEHYRDRLLNFPEAA